MQPVVYVTVVGAKIFYGYSKNEVVLNLTNYIAGGSKTSAIVQSCRPHALQYIKMTESQFIRFKNAGRRHASSVSGKLMGVFSRDRPNRTAKSSPLQKWDVGSYGDLTGHDGPWGNGSATNRDHMTANSSNQEYNQSLPIKSRLSASEVKRRGLAITVSGKHHREGSATYGGRSKKASSIYGYNRTQFGAKFPTEAFRYEMCEMLSHKTKARRATDKLRLEMTGAYTFMYKLAVDSGKVKATVIQDIDLIYFINLAVACDDGIARK